MIRQTQRPNELRFVLFEEKGSWVAVCLERYIGAQGRDPDQVEQRLKVAYRAELEASRDRTGTAFGGIDPAPKRFQEMWDSDCRKGRIHDKYADLEADLELAA